MPPYKVSFLGNSGVGKTSIIQEMDGGAQLSNIPTVAFDSKQIVVNVENDEVILNMFDTAGQDRFRDLAPFYIQSSTVVVLVFALDDRKSFEQIPDWMNLAKNVVSSNCIFFLVGNKLDKDDQIQISDIEIDDFANSVGIKNVLKTSVYTKTNIEELSYQIAQQCLQSIERKMENSINLDDTKKDKCQC